MVLHLRLHFENDFLELVKAFKSHAQLIANFLVNAELIPTSRFLFALEDFTSSHACLIYDEKYTIIHELLFVVFSSKCCWCNL